jgi:DNA-3-methyladenine glycosylase II
MSVDVFSDVSAACRALARKDAALQTALRAIGQPHIRRRAAGFEGLFRIIVEQQVSVPSAQAIWKRCGEGADVANAREISALGADGLKRFGLSAPKAAYVLGLAAGIIEGQVSLHLDGLDDSAAMARLTSVKGIGPWTASIYLLFCEGRVDIWPPNDVALKHAYGAAAGVPVDQKSLDAASGDWTPWRGVAAHILWTYYAHLRNRTPI